MENPVSAAPKAGGNKIAWFVALIVLFGVIVALNNVGEKDKKSSLEVASDETVEDVSGEDMIKASSAATVVANTDVDLALPYTAAMTKYAGRRVQFDSRCIASPVKSSFKDGTKIMLDNRGSAATRVVVGSMAFDIAAYNFAFLTLSATEFPATYSVDCGGVKGAAVITVTK